MSAASSEAPMLPFCLAVGLESGAMPRATNHMVRRASDMRGYYADEAALPRPIAAGDPVH